MSANIPREVSHGSRMKAVIFDNYVLNEDSRHIYNEQGATDKQAGKILVKRYVKKTLTCRTILGSNLNPTVTSVNWSIEGRNSRDPEWSEVYSFNATQSKYLAETINIMEEWDWIRVGVYVNGGSMEDNPIITCSLICLK